MLQNFLMKSIYINALMSITVNFNGEEGEHSLAISVESFILVDVTPFPILILNLSSSLFNYVQLLGYICYCGTVLAFL